MNKKSHYHLSVGSMLRQEENRLVKRKAKKRKKIIAISAIAIFASIMFSSRIGVSYYNEAAKPTYSPPPHLIHVEFGVIWELDGDYPIEWIKAGYP